jgi:hypothetical protein
MKITKAHRTLEFAERLLKALQVSALPCMATDMCVVAALGGDRRRGLLVVEDLTEIAHLNALAAGGALIEMLKFAFRLSTNADSFNAFCRVANFSQLRRRALTD